NIRRIDRFHSALAQSLVDRARNQPMRDIVKNLIAKALAHDLRRDFSRTKPRHPGSTAVIARDLIYFRVDDRAWNLHDEILLGIADVDEFCFHFWIGGVPCTPPGSLHSAYQPSPRSAVSSRAKAGGGGTRTPTACGQEI